MNEETAYEQQCYYLYQVGADVSEHFGTDGAEVSGHFGTSADMSYGQFGTGAEVSWVRSVSCPKCLYSIQVIRLTITGKKAKAYIYISPFVCKMAI